VEAQDPVGRKPRRVDDVALLGCMTAPGEPFRARGGFDRVHVSRILRWITPWVQMAPRRGSKPARSSAAGNPNQGRAEFFALPVLGLC
jgi:hypothetical protein